MTKEEFDAAVKDLRGKVVPRCANKKKADCTPEEWAACLDYLSALRNASDPDALKENNRKASQKYRLKHPEKRKESRKKWQDANPEKAKLAVLAWNARNADRVRLIRRRYVNKRNKIDPAFRIGNSLRKRLCKVVARNLKRGSAVRDLGCTGDELWVYLESQFQPGMTRENWGTAWEIDHIFPLAKANLKGSRTEFLAAVNWRNLQPLTPKQNGDKGDTVTPEAQALFDQLKAEFAGV